MLERIRPYAFLLQRQSTRVFGAPNPSATRRFRIRIRQQDFESSQQHYSFPKVFVVVTVLPYRLSIMVVEKELLKRALTASLQTSATLLSEVHNAMSDLQTPKNWSNIHFSKGIAVGCQCEGWSDFGRPEIGWVRQGADRNRAYVIVACDTQRFPRPLTESETEKYHIEFAENIFFFADKQLGFVFFEGQIMLAQGLFPPTAPARWSDFESLEHPGCAKVTWVTKGDWEITRAFFGDLHFYLPFPMRRQL
jgi:hypothetical protein